MSGARASAQRAERSGSSGRGGFARPAAHSFAASAAISSTANPAARRIAALAAHAVERRRRPAFGANSATARRMLAAVPVGWL